MPKDDSQITVEEFDWILMEVMNEHTGGQLLSVPGAYEIFSEHFNNEVLQRWEERNEEEESDG